MWNYLIAGITLFSFWFASMPEFPVQPGQGQRKEPVLVWVEKDGMGSIVKAVGGSMVNTGTEFDNEFWEKVELVVYANSQINPTKIHYIEEHPEIPRIDWPDYNARGASAISIEGVGLVQEGYWMGYDNAIIIAEKVGEALIRLGVEPRLIANNILNFKTEINALRGAGIQSIKALGRENSVWLTATPETAYILKNLNLSGGNKVIFVDGNPDEAQKIKELEYDLRGWKYAGIICPESYRTSESSNVVMRLSRDTGIPIAWVKFPELKDESTFLSVATYNNAMITAAASEEMVRREHSSKGGTSTFRIHMTYLLVIAGLVIYVVLLNKRLYYNPSLGGSLSTPKKKHLKK